MMGIFLMNIVSQPKNNPIPVIIDIKSGIMSNIEYNIKIQIYQLSDINFFQYISFLSFNKFVRPARFHPNDMIDSL